MSAVSKPALVVKFLTHLFLPHETNNQKAKLIHTSSIVSIALFIAGFQLLLNAIPKTFPSVLGYASNISATEVVRLTNEKRAQVGLSPLRQNATLDSAAIAKGQDMLSKGYWSHFGPDGTSPWSFFIKFGYKYQYAGENLARDFSSADGAMGAWMNSQTHKENILNPRYKEIGIGVVEGSLGGTDTTIIVQFFGSPLIGAPSVPIARAASVSSPSATLGPAKSAVATTPPAPVSETLQSPKPFENEQATGFSAPESPEFVSPKISPFQTTKSLSLVITGIVLILLSVDLIIIKRRRIVRIGGRTLAHLAYLSMVLAVILILKAGQII